MKLLPRLPRD